MAEKQAPPYSLRMPANLRAGLEEQARILKRTLNAEIVARLEASFSRHVDDADVDELLRRVHADGAARALEIRELEARLAKLEKKPVAKKAPKR